MHILILKICMWINAENVIDTGFDREFQQGVYLHFFYTAD